MLEQVLLAPFSDACNLFTVFAKADDHFRQT